MRRKLHCILWRRVSRNGLALCQADEAMRTEKKKHMLSAPPLMGKVLAETAGEPHLLPDMIC